ncbi:MAG TPA: folate-binding protein YgfZ [Rhodocyclaceae bacterium]|nr:folate-binding protein YgfZ [Rhodocyclaceae bacterium]
MNWTDFLTQQGARDDFLHFGDPEGELVSARTATVLVPLADLGLIRAAGEDAASFLHNLLTNDVKGLPADGVRASGMCNAKGRLLASFLMWHDESELLLALSADLLPSVLKKLSMYVLRSKVKLSDERDKTVLLGLSGPGAAEALAGVGATPSLSMTLGRFGRGQFINLGGDRHLLAVPAAEVQAVWRDLAALARPAGLAAWHWLEIVAGTPRVVAATQEEFVPQMVNFELVGGVSFNKGCYPGQEIVARTQYLGKIKRRMYRVRIEGAPPVPGAPLFAPETGEQACGTIALGAPSPQGGFEALAVVQSSCFEAGEVHLDNPAGPRLSFLPLPYELQPDAKPQPDGTP